MTDREKRARRRRVARLRSFIVFAVVVAVLSIAGYRIGRLIGGDRKDETPVMAGTAFAAGEAEETAVTPAPPPEPTIEPPPEADTDSWELRLVRFDHPLPDSFAPQLSEIEDGEMFDTRAAQHLRKLIKDARAAGYDVYVCSCYRSYETQSVIYWRHVDEYMDEGMTQEEAEAKTRLAVNYPGASEHQLGLAADLLESPNQDMEPYIGGSGLMLWLEEHCADYGFIIRYPEGKTDVTGVEYEPWHLRYVGVPAAYIMRNGLTLEEFLALYE